MKKSAFFSAPGFTVAAMIAVTLFSKILGLIRQMMMAGIFAATPEGIAFSAASGIPLAIFDMLFSTAVLGSFLPIYKGRLETDTKRAQAFSSSFLTGIVLVTTAAALIGSIFAHPILLLAAPELDGETASLALLLLRMMFPAVIFAGAAYTLVGILQSHEKFLLPAFVSALSNLVMILYLTFCPKPISKVSVIGLAVAYLVSWAVQFLTLAIPLVRQKKFPKPIKNILTFDTKLAAKRSLPVMFGSWLIPMTSLIAKSCSSVVDGNTIEMGAYSGTAIVVYENAFSIFTIAAGLLTYGICNYIFPKLSERIAKGDKNGFLHLTEIGTVASLALILPICATVFFLADEIVELLYLRGNFTQGLATATANALRILSFAMPAYGMTEFFSRVCYSCGKVRFPMVASLSGILLSLGLSAAFLVCGVISVETVSLAVVLGQVTACGILVCLFCLFEKHVLHLKKIIFFLPGLLLECSILWLSRNFLRQILHFSQTFQNFLIITIVFIVGFMVYLIWLVLAGILPVRQND